MGDETTRTAEDEKAQVKQDADARKQERDDVDAEVKELEENPPEKLEDWPSGKAKYRTFGGPEHESGYDEGPTQKLGPSELRHHEDGSVSIAGEQVEDPSKYKGDPIPGGPTDPDAPDDIGYTKTPPGAKGAKGGDSENEQDSAGSRES